MTVENALLNLVADIQAAVGDKEGRLMQPELIAHCRNLRETQDRLSDWLQMDAQDIRLRLGECTAQEIRTLKAVLRAIDGPVKPDTTW